MTSHAELEQLLKATLEDRRLSRGERRAIKQVLAAESLDETSRRQLRNRAFALAESELASREGRRVLDWLHDVVKALDDVALPVRPAPIEEAFFSPGPDCARRIVRLLAEARTSLDVCVFTVTDDSITRELIAAHERGAAVRVVTDDDKAGDRGSDVERLLRAGVPLRPDRSPAHMHHKYAIADARLLLTGSYNWTRSAAAENEENVLVTDARHLVERFAENFEALWRRLA